MVTHGDVTWASLFALTPGKRAAAFTGREPTGDGPGRERPRTRTGREPTEEETCDEWERWFCCCCWPVAPPGPTGVSSRRPTASRPRRRVLRRRHRTTGTRS